MSAYIGQMKARVMSIEETMKMKPFSWNDDKMRGKNDADSYLLCSGRRWSLRIEDQFQVDEKLQGTKCEILLELASILFTLMWKIKGRHNESNQMKAQCQEEMTIMSFHYLFTQ